MTIKHIAIGIFLFVIFNATSSIAKPNQITQFCGDRVCGYTETYVSGKKQYKKIVKWTRYIKHKKYVYKKSVKKMVKAVEPSGNLLNKAESFKGTNPTGWKSLWCARFIAVIAPSIASRLKAMGLNPNWARDYARLPEAKRSGGEPGDIIVLTRGKAGHIGVLKGYDRNHNPIVISGNHGRKVGEGAYARSRVLAYVPAS